MTKTSSEQRAPRKPRRISSSSIQQVDLQILDDVYLRAKEKLVEVQKNERMSGGASKTTLSDIGRRAILNWKPDGRRVYTPTPRSPNGARPERTPFRFKMSAQAYAEAAERIREHGISVTQVVEQALNRFAQAGS